MSADQRTKDMMRMAETIAEMAEKNAPDFEHLAGDEALRKFAEFIRGANARMADIGLPIN